ncbi:MAG: NUDIX domain-containing protein [Pseudomonadota bacterium]
MPISPYLKTLREKVGTDLLVLPSTSVIIFRDDGRFALLKVPGKDAWMMVGGFVEPFEHPADSAAREAWEEIGLDVELTHLIGVFGGPEGEVVYDHGDRVSYVSTVFGARIRGGVVKVDGDEAEDAGWFTPDEAREMRLTSLTRTVLSHLQADPGPAAFIPARWRPSADHRPSG